MGTVTIPSGAIEPIEVTALSGSGVALTGLTAVNLSIRKATSQEYYDFSTAALTFSTSGWTARQIAMTEVDSTNSPGAYRYLFDASTHPEMKYVVRVENTTAANFPQVGELEIGGVADDAIDIQRIVKNKLTIDDTSSKLQLWGDTGTAILYEWPLTDKDAAAITLSTGLPANRGVPV